MKNLFKCHFYYLMNHATIIIFVIANLLITIVFISNTMNSNLSSKYIINDYFITSSFTIRLVYGFVCVFMFPHSLLSKNDYYAYFILSCDVSRIKFILTKIFLHVLIIFVNILIIWLLFLIIGFVRFNDFYFKFIYLSQFLMMFLLVVIYGLYSMILIQFIKNLFIIIIPFLLIIVSSNIGDVYDKSFFEMFILFIFPDPNNIYGMLHLIWLVLILGMLNCLVYNIRDLNY